MAETPIRFDDGEAYERGMGGWTRIAGGIFLDWLAPSQGLRWIDVGCGNGAFTQLVVDRCAPREVQGIDPSEGQLAFAKKRPAARIATFREGHAMALPFEDARFDAATMALVIFFVPEPAKGVAEMRRVVAPGGIVAAYAWDMEGGGFPFQPIFAELSAMGLSPPGPPQPQASRLATLRSLWADAGLDSVETRTIVVERTFADFDEFWETSTNFSGMKLAFAKLDPAALDQLKSRVRARLTVDAAGGVRAHALANAVKGRVPQRA